jgi:hypothetical protein
MRIPSDGQFRYWHVALGDPPTPEPKKVKRRKNPDEPWQAKTSRMGWLPGYLYRWPIKGKKAVPLDPNDIVANLKAAWGWRFNGVGQVKCQYCERKILGSRAVVSGDDRYYYHPKCWEKHYNLPADILRDTTD